jgi:alpha-beta hydrolase superfamily lysophospholipase
VRLPRRAYLGAELPDDRLAFDGTGMRVSGILPGTMAARAGLAAGDVVTTIASAPVRSLGELGAALRIAGACTATTIEYLREGSHRQAEVTVERVPDEPAADYGVIDAGGTRLRTIRTRAANRARALVVFIQGIACESVDLALTPDAPLAGIVAGWTHAGFDTLRFDKRGTGDSEGGTCAEHDFATELADARTVVEHAFAEHACVIVCGHSVGGIIAPQLAAALPLAGVIVYGAPVMRWLACLQDSARRQLVLRGAPAAVIAARIAELAQLAERGELNGRSAAYHRQLDAIDGEAAWQRVRLPVLVARGEHDWVVDADDQARVATLAGGPTTVVDVPGLDHLFGHHAGRDASLRDYGAGTFDPAFVDATVAWLCSLNLA